MTEIVIYTKSSCGYCFAAKNLLRQAGLPFTEIAVDRDPERLAEMIDRSQARTVPQVFVDDEPIGGYEQLAQLLRSGRLTGEA